MLSAEARAGLVQELAAIVGREQVHDGPGQLIAYSLDGTFQQYPPDVAVTPGSTEEVAGVVRVAARLGVPLIPRGTGSGLAGGTVPLTGGIVLSLARLTRIKEIDRVNTCAVVEAGVVTARLQAAVERVGLFYPPDPASLNQSTIGGNVATNAGGPRCLKYGVTKDYVIGMTVVLADGRVLRLGGKLIKNATGYQLMQLFVGSEGTLGVVTEVTLRLIPLPRVRSTAAAVFDSLDGATSAVADVLGGGILPVTCELIDRTCINLVEDYLGLGLPREAEAMLLLEQDGSDEAAVQAEVERMADICRSAGARSVQVARSAAERSGLWQARRAVSAALGRQAPNKLGEDIVVPRSELPRFVRRVAEISAAVGLPIPVFGHAGDGNLHPNILFDRHRPGELARVERAAALIFAAALELGGTLTGEHGVGALKREFLVDDLGADAVDVMRALKAALDPRDLLNPGKMFPQHARPAAEAPPGHPGFLTDLPTLDGLRGEW